MDLRAVMCMCLRKLTQLNLIFLTTKYTTICCLKVVTNPNEAGVCTNVLT